MRLHQIFTKKSIGSDSIDHGFTCTATDMIGSTKAGKQYTTVDKEAILAPVPYSAGPHTIIASVSAAVACWCSCWPI
jgi:hypothetical protein